MESDAAERSVTRDVASRLRRCESSEMPVRLGPLVILAQWHHPFPFRTRKLNAAAPMVVRRKVVRE